MSDPPVSPGGLWLWIPGSARFARGPGMTAWAFVAPRFLHFLVARKADEAGRRCVPFAQGHGADVQNTFRALLRSVADRRGHNLKRHGARTSSSRRLKACPAFGAGQELGLPAAESRPRRARCRSLRRDRDRLFPHRKRRSGLDRHRSEQAQAQARRQPANRARLSLDRGGRDISLLLEMVLGLVLRPARAELARAPEP